MQHLLTGSFRLCVAIFVVGCASIQETDERGNVETGPQTCALTPTALRTLRARALEYLVQEWPVLDERCEHISDTVVVARYGCMILGGPRRGSSCEPASHFGYGIVYDQETLDPIEMANRIGAGMRPTLLPPDKSLHGTTGTCHGCCRLGGNSRGRRAVARELRR